MSKREKGSASEISRERPAITPEGREDQCINLAMNLAEQKLREGTASNSMIIHFLRLGSTRGRAETEILSEKKKLVTAQTDALESAKRSEEAYAEVMKAMKLYTGHIDSMEDEDGYY